jgi:hypothetical protein
VVFESLSIFLINYTNDFEFSPKIYIYIFKKKNSPQCRTLPKENTFCGYLNFQRTTGSGFQNISDSENCQFWFLEKMRMPKSSPMHTKDCFTLGVRAEKTWGQL